jgi:hypothetical protein
MGKKQMSLEVVNPNAAGIDVGSKSHWIAIGQDAEDIREFGVYSEDHQELCKWLSENKITSIAMESTGTYWQNLFSALTAAGFEVILVNGKQTKNVKGKKTDIKDCQWIQKLHCLGLLSHSFLPDSTTDIIRTYSRHRQNLIKQSGRTVLKVQKYLRLMNMRLDVVVNDVVGLTGTKIINTKQDRMKKLLLSIIVTFICSTFAFGQDLKEKEIEGFQDEIVKLINKESENLSINQYKHINQAIGLKDGLWIEPDRNKLWFIKYENGERNGRFYCYSLYTRKKELEGKYKNGILTDTIMTYDANGKIYSLYTGIKPTTKELKIDYEYPTGESFTFKSELHKFEYEANVKRYTAEGIVYTEGIGLFDDEKTYLNYDKNNPSLGYNNSLSIFRIYKFGDWKNY